MDRFTFLGENGRYNADIKSVFEDDFGISGTCSGEAIARLAAYENTGLTPDRVKRMRWIPVEEGLPEDFETVIITDSFGTECGYFVSDTGWKDTDMNSIIGVTHWMPLSEAPEVYHG